MSHGGCGVEGRGNNGGDAVKILKDLDKKEFI